MTNNRKSTTLATLSVVLFSILAGILIGSCGAPQLGEQDPPQDLTSQTRGSGDLTGITHFNNLSTTDLAVADDATIGDALTAADLISTDDVTVGDDLTVTGSGTLAGLAILDDTNLTVTTATITPTTSTYHADSAGNVTWTLPACSVNGQLLLIYGDDANTITIADAALRSSDGNAATVGQYDLLLLVCFDTEWVQLAKSANS